MVFYSRLSAGSAAGAVVNDLVLKSRATGSVRVCVYVCLCTVV